MLTVPIHQHEPTPPAASPVGAAHVETFLPDVAAVSAAVLGVGRDHPDVQDAVSETMRRAIEGMGRLHDGEPLRPWLMGIARHVALDARRARGRSLRRRAPETVDGASPLDDIPVQKPGPFEQLADARRAAKVKEALARLPEGPRQALTLFHLEGVGYDEITRRLGVPMGTVATWVSRGRKALLGELESEGTMR
jgi:RNA polymerase sigma factor (sigma-70 family)